MVGDSLVLSLPSVSGLSSISKGKTKYHRRTVVLKGKQKESQTNHGSYLFKRLVSKFHTDLEVYLKKVKEGKAGNQHHSLGRITLKSQVISHLVFKCYLNGLSAECKRTNLGFNVGQKLQDELNFSNLKRNNPLWYKKLSTKVARRASYGFKRNLIIRAANQDLGDSWKTDLGVAARTQIGIILLEILRQSTGLFTYENRKTGRNKTTSFIVPTEETLKWIDSFNSRASELFPYYLPCKSVPPDWTSVISGGYEFPENINWHFVKRKNRQTVKDTYANEDLSLVFSAANRLQRTPFRITSRTLAVVHLGEGEENSIRDNHLRFPNGTKEWKRCQALMHSRRRKRIPQIIQNKTIRELAKDHISSDIYFPVQADFRGRLYYVPKLLNPQGPDKAKGLLEFAEGKLVRGNEHWFLIGGANRYGIKGSFEDRQEWALKHEKWIKAVASDPEQHQSFWQDSECPMEFLQWCFEFDAWMKNRISFKSHLPVKLDHTASGMQIIGLLTGDKELQRLTNLTSSDEPVDLYSELLQSIQAKIIKSGRPESVAWLSLGLNRSVIKSLTVMYMYGGTPHGMKQTVVDWYKSLPNDHFGKTVYFEIDNLLNIYHEALDDLTEAPREFMHSCQQMVKRGESLSWTSLSGFPVDNEYTKTKSTRLRTSVNREVISFHLNTPTGDLAYRKAKNAVAANIIHSYDAALLHKILSSCEYPILALHDCYGVHPVNVDELLKTCQTTICSMFTLDTPKGVCYALS